jgi:hypothetical protein
VVSRYVVGVHIMLLYSIMCVCVCVNHTETLNALTIKQKREKQKADMRILPRRKTKGENYYEVNEAVANLVGDPCSIACKCSFSRSTWP